MPVKVKCLKPLCISGLKTEIGSKLQPSKCVHPNFLFNLKGTPSVPFDLDFGLLHVFKGVQKWYFDKLFIAFFKIKIK